ncbi:MAG TPA: hypothetical protein VKS79_20490 [Gemmataceae bacterium]|nr:hypothetical protein [Gemmataceae bacterium]
MINFYQLKAKTLRSGHVGERELDLLCEELYAESRLDFEIAEFLASIRREARSVCAAFELLFVDVVALNTLVDGAISADGAAWLRKLLVTNGPATEADKKLLWELKRKTKTVCPEFRQLYEECVG